MENELYPIGTEVIFTNEFGVVFDRGQKVTGYLDENNSLYKRGYRYFISDGSSWMPKKQNGISKK